MALSHLLFVGGLLAVALAIGLKELAELHLGLPGALDPRSGLASCLALLLALGLLLVGPRSRQREVLAVDLDECCCGYLPAFIEFSNEMYATELKLAEFHSYMFWQVEGCRLASREQAMDRVYEFHASRHFSDIQPLPGAFEALQRLARRYELHVVTSRQLDIEPQTRAFVTKHFPGVFANIHLGNHFGRDGTKLSKPEMCRHIGAFALLDDSLDYARQCSDAGLEVYLFGNYGWNRTSEGLGHRVKRVEDWNAACTALLSRPQLL